MNKKLAFVEIAMLSVAIYFIDYHFRSAMIDLGPKKHLAVIAAAFLLYYLIKLVIGMLPSKLLRTMVGSVVGIGLGLLYGVDYNYLATYGRFMGPHEFSMLIGEFGYWQGNVDKMFSTEELLSLVYYAAPFIVVFSGLLGYVLSRLLPNVFNTPISQAAGGWQKTNLIKRTITSSAVQVLCLPVAVYGVIKIVDYKNAEYFHTPEFASYYGLKEFVQNPDTFKIQPASVEFPEREGDPSAVRVNQRKPNIVFMLFESLNMKKTSMHGFVRDTTPNLKAYVQDNFQFDGVSNSTTTTFSTTSLFSGYDYSKIKINDTLNYPLLWWYTKFAGYENHVFTSQWLLYRSKGDYFIDRERTDTLKEPLYSNVSLGRDDFITVSELEKALPSVKGEEGKFIYINYSGTHFPYRVGEGYRVWRPTRSRGFHPQFIRLTLNQYNNAMLYFDAAFQKTIEVLEQQGVLDDSIVILASDHGEAMMEHGRWGHGPVFWQEGIQSPIYIKIGKNVRSMFTDEEVANLESNQSYYVSNVDIFKTVLDIVGIKSERDLSGNSLLQPYPEDIAYSNRDKLTFAALNSHTGFKLIVSNKLKHIYCMNIKTDPDELKVRSFSFSQERFAPTEGGKLLLGRESCDLPYTEITPPQ